MNICENCIFKTNRRRTYLFAEKQIPVDFLNENM